MLSILMSLMLSSRRCFTQSLRPCLKAMLHCGTKKSKLKVSSKFGGCKTCDLDSKLVLVWFYHFLNRDKFIELG